MGKRGESSPKVGLRIAILELRNQKIISETVPPEGEWIYLDKWMPKERLLGHRSSGFGVSGFFVIEALEGPPGSGLSPREHPG